MIGRKEGSVGWMIFNAPERRNAVSYAMWEAIPDILDDFARDDSVRAIVMRGAGDKAFVSGADISEFENQRASTDAVERYNRTAKLALDAIATLEKPVIAMIEGFCLGGGVAVALGADIRIASDESRFGIPAARLSLGYDLDGIAALVDLIGPAGTKEMLLTARRYTAAEAREMRLVNQVVRHGELEAVVRDCAQVLADNAPLTIRAAKAAVAEALRDRGQADAAKIERMVAECYRSEDYVEGRRAFMEKRKPVFRGR